MMLLSFSETKTSFDPFSAHFLAQSALSMSLAPHFSSLTQPLILVSLGALSLARDSVDATNVSANATNRSFFMGTVSPQRMLLVSANCLQQLRRVELLSYDGKNVTKKIPCGLPSAKAAAPTLKVKATSSLALAQLRAGRWYKQPRPAAHSGVVHALLFQ